MKTSLIALGITVLMAWLTISHGLNVWTAIHVATMILGLIIVAVAMVLAERYQTPDDLGLAWQRTLNRLREAIRSKGRR
jgi:hypothetical protein